ncbi:MAG: metallophosphoesterase, partial [Prevotella sp.]|nr:metallophosphoesterase [Prevotella sp.]
PEQDMFHVQRGMNDFRQIMYDGRRFTPDDFNLEHEKCLTFLKQAVKESTAKHIVVVTHHLPTLSVVAAQYMGSVLNGAFATELGNYIADSRIDAWIYGHSHTNIDTTIGNTRIVCNQLGYVYYNEQQTNGFEPNKIIEL